MIEVDELIRWLTSRVNFWHSLGRTDRENECRRVLGYINKLMTEASLKAIEVFDEVETCENCTVQVLKNTATGEVSIGWWRNEVGES